MYGRCWWPSAEVRQEAVRQFSSIKSDSLGPKFAQYPEIVNEGVS
jgi:hypothetical protein